MAEKKSPSPKTKKTTSRKTAEADPQEKVVVEEMKVAGSQLVEKVKELIEAGNIRRIVIKQNDKILLNIPLTFAAVGFMLAPILAGVGTLAALVADCTLQIEKTDK